MWVALMLRPPEKRKDGGKVVLVLGNDGWVMWRGWWRNTVRSCSKATATPDMMK